MMRLRSAIGAMGLVGVISVATASTPSSAPRAFDASSFVAERTTWDSVYSAVQANQGRETYDVTCARCHQRDLGGADQSPALVGGGFLGNWSGQTLLAFSERVRRTMPSDAPGTYSRQEIADVTAYILQANGFPSGRVALPNVDAALAGIVIQGARR